MLLFLGSFGNLSIFLHIFDVLLDLVVLVYFNAISIDFYAIKGFICINLV